MSNLTHSIKIISRKRALVGAIALAIGSFGAGGALTHVDFANASTNSELVVGYPEFADIVEQVQPAVVNIAVRESKRIDSAQANPTNDPRLAPFFRHFFGQDQNQPFGGTPGHDRERQGLGSGFLVSPDGFVVTNHHVVGDADEITVTLDNGEQYIAQMVGKDDKTDLALLKIDNEEPLPFVDFAGSDEVRTGDWVVAIGNPFGLGSSVSAGIISARGRDIQSGPYDDFLQIDAPINRGNSGGPLFDTRGQVIGVNTAIFSPNGGNIGIGFAIPASTAAGVVADLKRLGHVNRGWLGVEIQSLSEDIAENLGLPNTEGALVVDVTPDSPAMHGGLQRGDVIQAIDGKAVVGPKALSLLVAAIDPGTTVVTSVWRNGAKSQLQVELGNLARTSVALNAKGSDRPELESTLGLVLSPLPPQSPASSNAQSTGALVSQVDPDSHAAKKKMGAGDVILSVDDREIKNPQDVYKAVAQAKQLNRASVLLLITRDERHRFVALPIS